ncbi:PepSY domain-containing protein [Acinetobacter rathckeae]|uniref:PepSY domain-containing protein n=1 Tax=Acinetobacter rathckeae TaxID=2605272 RepID=UPI0018A29A06|nr:sulfite reductase flavoprotein subunit alpha [Acinetobacter rathckeae]MBF7695811.1 PepSY domain-containing protein [Acinetobacter rathckeae]
MLKKTLFQLHWFLGITAGLILSLMGVTGAIYSYDQQILKWINEDSYTVQVPTQQAKLTPSELYQKLISKDNKLEINSITVVNEADASSIVNVKKEGERRGFNLMVNPYDASILPDVKGREFFQFIQQLHRNLTFGPLGKQITAACSLMLIYFVLSGLYLRWPKKHSIKQWLAVKPKLKGRNFIWDLHAVVGTWVIVFYLLFAMTGLYWSYDWWRDGMFKVLGVEKPQQMQAPAGGQKPEGMQGQGRPQNGEKSEGMQGQGRPQNGEKSEGMQGQGRPQNGEKSEGMQAQGRPQNGEKSEGMQGNGFEKGANKAPLSTEQIESILSQTWQGFNQQYKNGYSSITLNIPKTSNGKVELSFVDAEIQHERARNSASYNYTTQNIDNLKLYSDKKLNDKIMSSMLPVHRGSFFGPVWQFVAMLASLAMPLFFITGIMLYLKRRKQKKLTKLAKTQIVPVVTDNNAPTWLVVYASQTGISEQLAWRTASSLQEAKQTTNVKSIQHVTTDDLKSHAQVLWVVSTYGTGDAPDVAVSFSKKIMKQTLDLSHVQYAVLALGSKEYFETYCSFGHEVDAWLNNAGATRLFNTIEVDDANIEDIQKWNQQLANVTHLDLHDIDVAEKTFDTWTLQQRKLLNADSLGQPAYHIELIPQADITWQAGDIAVIQPMNSPDRISQFIEQHSFVNLNSAQIASLKNKDLTHTTGDNTDFESMLETLKPLPAREYSIASIPKQQQLQLVVRLAQDKEGEYGLGSGWLCQHAPLNENIELRIRTNEAFHLIDDNRPILLIGNGTGIAGLMSLLQQREDLGYTENWLVWGERQRAKDHFYQQQLEAWQHSGLLSRLDLVFSRDQESCKYVQDQLMHAATDVKAWVERGAVIYVCGSVQGMASGVDQALKDILGETLLDELREHDRYRRDVY